MPNLAQLLSSKSPAEYQRVFDHCRELTKNLDSVEDVFLVGGFTRDLILDREPGDIDISVVGDARTFSEALADRLEATTSTGSQFLTFKIESVKTLPDVASIDIVTARSETYGGPAALPEITPASIEDDLKRRDFTINSMAISLSDSFWGNLIDPANGFGDVMRKRIKILHDSSFIDDPTRIFRAVRYAVRLGFSIDSKTSELMSSALGNIDNLSGARIRNEFELMLREPTRVQILRKSEEIGLLGAISPGLRVGSRAHQVLEEQANQGALSPNISDLLAITTSGLNEAEAAQVVERFDGPAEWGDPILGNVDLARHVGVLDQPNVLPSEIAEVLSPIPEASIRAYIAAGPPLPRRERLTEYLDKIRFVKLEITGDDLTAAGIPEGPVIGQLIDIVTRAKLNGQVRSKRDELELAKSRLPGLQER